MDRQRDDVVVEPPVVGVQVDLGHRKSPSSDPRASAESASGVQ
jgi:hypothetical protein